MSTQVGTRSGRWGVVIFWCLVLLAVGLLLRVVSPSRSTSSAEPAVPVSTPSE